MATSLNSETHGGQEHKPNYRGSIAADGAREQKLGVGIHCYASRPTAMMMVKRQEGAKGRQQQDMGAAQREFMWKEQSSDPRTDFFDSLGACVLER